VRELTDLSVEFVDELLLLFNFALGGFITEEFIRAFEEALLPQSGLRGVNFMPGTDRGHGVGLADKLQSDLALELGREHFFHRIFGSFAILPYCPNSGGKYRVLFCNFSLSGSVF